MISWVRSNYDWFISILPYFNNLLFKPFLHFWIISPFVGGSEVEGRFVEEAYVPWALLVAIFIGGTIFWSAWGTRSVIPSLKKIAVKTQFSVLGLFHQLGRDFKDVTRSLNFRFLFAGVLLVYITVGVTQTLDMYMYTYFWELDEQIILPVLMAFAIGNGLGTLVSVKLFSISLIWLSVEISKILSTLAICTALVFDLVFTNSFIPCLKILVNGSSILTGKELFKLSADLAFQNLLSNSEVDKFIFLNNLYLSNIKAQEYIELDNKSKITNLTTKSARKNSCHSEKSFTPPNPTT